RTGVGVVAAADPARNHHTDLLAGVELIRLRGSLAKGRDGKHRGDAGCEDAGGLDGAASGAAGHRARPPVCWASVAGQSRVKTSMPVSRANGLDIHYETAGAGV